MRNRPGRFTNLPPHIPSPRSNSCTLRAIHIHHNEYGETFSSLIVSNTLRGELFREAPAAGSTQSYTRSHTSAGARSALSPGPATSLATFQLSWTVATAGRKYCRDGRLAQG